MRTVMAKRLTFLLVVAVGTASCGTESESFTVSTPAATTSQSTATAQQPVNVVNDVELLTHDATGSNSVGVDVSLQSCTLIAPGMLRLAGEIDMPAGFDPGSVVLTLGTTVADMGFSQPVRVGLSEAGSFTFDVPLWNQEDLPDSGFFEIEPARDMVDSCSLAAGPVEGNYVSLEIAEATYRDEAPGSIQDLGRGARLGDLSDPRLIYAYLSSLEWELPFDVIWAPDPATGIVVTKLDDYRDPTEPCPRMSLEINLGGETVGVHQEQGCYTGAGYPFDPAAVDSGNLVAGSDRLTWWDSEGHRFAGLVDGDLTVQVAGTADSAVAQVAAALHEYTNTHVRAAAASPQVGEDIEEVLGPLLEANGMVERARFEYRQAQMVIVVEGTPDPTSALGYIVADLTTNGWYVPDYINMRSPAWDRCTDGMGAGDSQGGFHFFGVKDPTWVLEVDTGEGWERPAQLNGVAFFPFGPEDQLISHMLDAQFRAVTEDGNDIPECS